MTTNWTVKFLDNEGNTYYRTENGYHYMMFTSCGKQRISRISKELFMIAVDLYLKEKLNHNKK